MLKIKLLNAVLRSSPSKFIKDGRTEVGLWGSTFCFDPDSCIGVSVAFFRQSGISTGRVNN